MAIITGWCIIYSYFYFSGGFPPPPGDLLALAENLDELAQDIENNNDQVDSIKFEKDSLILQHRMYILNGVHSFNDIRSVVPIGRTMYLNIITDQALFNQTLMNMDIDISRLTREVQIFSNQSANIINIHKNVPIQTATIQSTVLWFTFICFCAIFGFSIGAPEAKVDGLAS